MNLIGFHSKLFPVLSTTTRFTCSPAFGIARASSEFRGKFFSITTFPFRFLSIGIPDLKFFHPVSKVRQLIPDATAARPGKPDEWKVSLECRVPPPCESVDTDTYNSRDFTRRQKSVAFGIRVHVRKIWFAHATHLLLP